MQVHRQRLTWLAAAAAATLACQYAYDNPAERLSAGQVSGRTVTQVPAPVPAPGVAVVLKGSNFSETTHETGRFTLLPLPVGRHILLFREGTARAMLRVVDVALGRDGQPEGVRLGDVAVPGGASLRGVVAVPSGAPQAGVVVDERTGLTSTLRASTGYQLDVMGPGDHLLKLALVDRSTGDEWLGGPLPVTVIDSDQHSVKPVATVPLRVATPAVGTLRFRVLSLQPGLPAAAMVVEVEEAVRGPVAGPLVPDSSGDVELSLPEGLYRVRLSPPPEFESVAPAPQPATAVVLAGLRADVGSLYLVPTTTVVSAQAYCIDTSDCGTDHPCQDHVCSNYRPTPPIPPDLPFCDLQRDGNCSYGSPCFTSGGFPGVCLAAGPWAGCVACGSACTPEGTSSLVAPPMDPAKRQCLP